MKKREIDSQSPSERGYEDVFHVYKQIKSLENGDKELPLNIKGYEDVFHVYKQIKSLENGDYERVLKSPL